MKSKAEYIGRSKERYSDNVALLYKYRGREYYVNVNDVKGNEPLSWQHANAQAKIDREIEIEEQEKKSDHVGETVQESLDRFFDFLETGEWKE